MFRNRLFWIVLVALSVAGSLYAIKFFPEAFPILSVDLTMDRGAALKQGRGIAESLHLGPTGKVRETALFDSDSEVQNYVELEGGGKPAFRALIASDPMVRYAPYQWIVRLFREGEKDEAKVYFTPRGEPYGFEETIPESRAGAALSSDAALALAKKDAAEQWGVSFDGYNPPDASQTVRPSGRVDHSFVFERPERIGEGRYQLTLVVSGDRLTTVLRSIQVPQAFLRRYQQMRAANESFYTASWTSVAVLYIIGGCLIGLFFLLRDRWVLWRGAVAAGLLVAFLQVLAALNGLSLQWMQYDTALSIRTFILTSIVAPQIRGFIQDAILFTLPFIAAESLTRRAFPRHVQVWKLWTVEAAASPELLGRTLAGYLVVGIDMAFLVAFYIVTGRYFGWWSPAEALIDPNLPGNYLPWFSPIAQAMQAGTWEESLFRAVPLAGAALVGGWLEKKGRKHARKIAISIAFVVQIFIFGAGHATYPVQPAYGRMVELIVPSMIFASLYLRFGLLPAIVAHFFFDVLMMSLPLLVSSLPGVWFDRCAVVAVALVPLWVVLGARLRRKSKPLPDSFRNGAWRPPAPHAPEAETVLETAVPPTRDLLVGWIVAGIAGLVLWAHFAEIENLAPKLPVARAKAVALARTALAEKKIVLDPSWTVVASALAPRGDDDSFVWRQSGRDGYRAVMQSFLEPPSWRVRFVHFTGNVARRAEEYQVKIARNGETLGIVHQLPEAAPGATLREAEARVIADGAVRERFGVDPAALRPVGSQATRQPNRTDWQFLYADPDPVRYPLKAGEGRYAVLVAGNEVADAHPYVFVPDAWTRGEIERQAPLQAFSSLASLGLVAAMVGALLAAIVAWSLGRFSARTFVLFLAGVMVLRVAELALAWPAIVAGFTTSQPVGSQAFSAVGGQLIHALFGAISIGAAAGYFQALRRNRIAPHSPLPALAIAAGLALAWVGVRAATGSLLSLVPPWADYAQLGAAIPWLSAALSRLVDILYTTAEFFWLLRLADVVVGKGHGKWRSVVAPSLLIVAGTTLYLGAGGIDSLGSWFLSGLAAGAVVAVGYFTFLREHRAWLPFAFGLIGGINAVKQAILAPWPGAWGNALGALLLVAIGWLWTRRLAAEARRQD